MITSSNIKSRYRKIKKDDIPRWAVFYVPAEQQGQPIEIAFAFDGNEEGPLPPNPKFGCGYARIVDVDKTTTYYAIKTVEDVIEKCDIL